MRKGLCAILTACLLTGALGIAAVTADEKVEWNNDTWSVNGEGDAAEYTAPEKNFLSGIKTTRELSYNCIEYDIRALDLYGTVDGNVGFCYTCGDTEYFFELNTVGDYLRIRRMTPTETLKTSNTGFHMQQGQWYHFKIIVAPGLLRWYIDGELVANCRDTSECSMDKGWFFIQGYNAQPQVKNIRVYNEDVQVATLDFEFGSEKALGSFVFTPYEGAEAGHMPKIEDGLCVWPLSGSLTSAVLDTAPGDVYSMKLPLRNTFCVRLKNDSAADKLRLSFITEKDGEYDEVKSKTFDILPNSGYFTYYFNISDVDGASGYLRGFRLETPGVSEGTIYIDAITFEREAKIYDYAGSVDSCVTDGETVTVTGKLKPEYAGHKVTIYETSITNYNFVKSNMKKLAAEDAAGETFTVTFPLMNKKLSRLSSHFFAVVDGVFVAPWFTIENYYEFSENPYRFELPMKAEVVVTDSPYGARGDGFSNDTDAIQQAIDDVSAAGGGRVVVPGDTSAYGKRYIVTTLTLKDNVELYLDENAVLWQSPRAADYAYTPARGHDVSIPGVNWTHAGLCHNYPFVYAYQAHNIKLTGKGTLRLNDVGSECEDGVNGSTIWTGCGNRIHLIALALVECTDVQLSGFTINRANCYHLSLFACSRVYISDVTMNEATCASGDGIGLSSATHDVKIDRCFLFSNDDAVTMTSSYNDPRGLVWWHANTERDNSVYNVEVCHSDLFGGHGLTFITWGTDNPDLSKQEIYNVRAYDNVLSGGSSVGTWCDNPYYGRPFDNLETDDYSPVRDVRIFANSYRSNCSLLSVKPTNLVTDCKIYSASDFQNGDFERRNGKAGWVSGLSNWSSEGNRAALSFIEYPEGSQNHCVRVSGEARLYQGLYFKRSTVTVSFKYRFEGNAAGGGADFFVAEAGSGAVLATVPVNAAASDAAGVTGSFESFSWTGALDKGTYMVGIVTYGGAEVIADEFKAETAAYNDALAAVPGSEIIGAFVDDDRVLYPPASPVKLEYPRYLAETVPYDARLEPVNPENENSTPAPDNAGKALPRGAIAAICAAIAAAVSAAAALVVSLVRRKKKSDKQ